MPSDLSSEAFGVSEAWLRTFPGAHAGLLVMHDLANPEIHEALEARKARLQVELRERFDGMDRGALRKEPTLAAYGAYYRQFDKNYHVQLQLESIVIKGKQIPTAAGLVEAMFMAELSGLLLTAGHDLDSISAPLLLDVATGTETYTLLRGEQCSPKPGDMTISDQGGIISSIVYGPDQRTRIRPETSRALFTIYAPAGITPDAIEAQLNEIAKNARLIAPNAVVDVLTVFPNRES